MIGLVAVEIEAEGPQSSHRIVQQVGGHNDLAVRDCGVNEMVEVWETDSNEHKLHSTRPFVAPAGYAVARGCNRPQN